LVMVSSAAELDCFSALLYVYVNDADTTYRRALNAGAEPDRTGPDRTGPESITY
jgi:hypothetical protein